MMLISPILDQIMQGARNLKWKIRGSGTVAKKSAQRDTLCTPSPPTAVVREILRIPQTASSKANADVRMRLVHFLAVETCETDLAVARVCGNNCDATTRSNLLSILEEVAEQAPARGDKKWSLKDSTWLEVRPYEWETYRPSERNNIARQGRLVLSSLKIPESEPVWDHFRLRTLALPTGAVLHSSHGNDTITGPPAGILQHKPKPKRPTVLIPPAFFDGERGAGSSRSCAQNLVSGMPRRRDGSDIQLREPPIIEVPCTAGKPIGHYHARKPSASSSRPLNTHLTEQPSTLAATQSAPSSPQLTLPTVAATASMRSAVAGTAGTTGTLPRPNITIAGWRARFMAWVCCMHIQHTEDQH
ncbi:hypothetical protein EV702DRAFT_31407 [Suillus placidus]|uniref:RNA polymerase II elongation factor ELL N-terminal domain-containing protein n=1 Tax=Suillus placidus TaxID=48579 RepID=A0A9P7A7S0_9AGAM|nr:hypothetical protein EV702DRAFT_31407 [Suillus placidus]